jgi:hypothetical protein
MYQDVTMNESERLQRHKEYSYRKSQEQKDEDDTDFTKKLCLILNQSCCYELALVDALYYDFSMLPDHLKGTFHTDMYLVYGITYSGDMVSTWATRAQVDS